MQVKINLSFLNDYVSRFTESFFQLELKENSFTLEIAQDGLLTALNPYAILEIKRELSSTWTNLYWDHNIISKFHKTDNDFLIIADVKENYDIREDLNILKKELIDIINKYYLNLEITVDAQNVDENLVSIGGVSILKDHVTNTVPVLKVEILYSVDELYQLYSKNPQITKMKFAKDVLSHRYGRDTKDYYIVLFKDNRVIGLSHMFPSYERKGSLTTSFTSIIEEEQGNGYSSLILEKRIELLKELNMDFHSSSYSPFGFERLRPKILELCEKNGIKIHENGLHMAAETFAQAVYSEQKSFEKKINDAKMYKDDKFFTLEGYVSCEDELLVEFLKENIHKLTNKEEYLKFYKKYERFLDDYVLRFIDK